MGMRRTLPKKKKQETRALSLTVIVEVHNLEFQISIAVSRVPSVCRVAAHDWCVGSENHRNGSIVAPFSGELNREARVVPGNKSL